jgi:hypothetical protein
MKIRIQIELRITSNPYPLRIIQPYSLLNQLPQLQLPPSPETVQINGVEIGWSYPRLGSAAWKLGFVARWSLEQGQTDVSIDKEVRRGRIGRHGDRVCADRLF